MPLKLEGDATRELAQREGVIFDLLAAVWPVLSSEDFMYPAETYRKLETLAEEVIRTRKIAADKDCR